MKDTEEGVTRSCLRAPTSHSTEFCTFWRLCLSYYRRHRHENEGKESCDHMTEQNIATVFFFNSHSRVFQKMHIEWISSRQHCICIICMQITFYMVPSSKEMKDVPWTRYWNVQSSGTEYSFPSLLSSHTRTHRYKQTHAYSPTHTRKKSIVHVQWLEKLNKHVYWRMFMHSKQPHSKIFEL